MLTTARGDTGNKQRFWWYGGSLQLLQHCIPHPGIIYNTLHMAAYEPVATGSQLAMKSTYSADIQNFSGDLLDDQLNTSAVADIASPKQSAHTAVRHETAESPSSVSSSSAHLAAANGSTSQNRPQTRKVQRRPCQMMICSLPMNRLPQFLILNLLNHLLLKNRKLWNRAAAEKAELAALMAEDRSV